MLNYCAPVAICSGFSSARDGSFGVMCSVSLAAPFQGGQGTSYPKHGARHEAELAVGQGEGRLAVRLLF